jgi:hypothetical protein
MPITDRSGSSRAASAHCVPSESLLSPLGRGRLATSRNFFTLSGRGQRRKLGWLGSWLYLWLRFRLLWRHRSFPPLMLLGMRTLQRLQQSERWRRAAIGLQQISCRHGRRHHYVSLNLTAAFRLVVEDCCIGGRREPEGARPRLVATTMSSSVVTIPWAFAWSSIRRWSRAGIPHRTVRSHRRRGLPGGRPLPPAARRPRRPRPPQHPGVASGSCWTTSSRTLLVMVVAPRPGPARPAPAAACRPRRAGPRRPGRPGASARG